MPSRIERLTPAQKARMASWADEWIARGLDCAPADESKVADGIRRCYEAAGIPWHGNVIWVDSPIVMAFAAPIAAHIIDAHGAVRGAVDDAVDNAVRGAVDDAVDNAVRGAVDNAVRGAVDNAVRGVVRGAVDGAVHNAVRGAVDNAVGIAVDDAVGDAVDNAVDGAVSGAVRRAVDNAVGIAVDDAVGGVVSGAVDDAVGDGVHNAVSGAVDDAVGDGVHNAVSGAWWKYWGGTWWAGWNAYLTFFTDVCGLNIGDELAEANKARIDAMEAGWWWPHRKFVIVVRRQTEVHTELVDPSRSRGWGSHRLHNDSGPSIAWADGWALWHVHGTQVTEQIVMRPETITAEQISREENAEVRRIMADRIGNARMMEVLGAQAIASDDYGVLWDADPLPGMGVTRCRWVELVDASPEPIGSDLPVLDDAWSRRYEAMTGSAPIPGRRYRRYLIPVPAEMPSAHAAVAWHHGMSTHEYVLDGIEAS